MAPAWIEHLIGPFAEKLFGGPAIFGGILLALGGWFCDYAVIEWRQRRGYSVVMWACGLALVEVVLYMDWDADVLLRCVILGVLMYLPLHQSTRRWRRNEIKSPDPAAAARE
jgi:hypothetical protein